MSVDSPVEETVKTSHRYEVALAQEQISIVKETLTEHSFLIGLTSNLVSLEIY